MELVEIVEIIRETTRGLSSRISVCAAAGVSCEGWLKVELLHAFTLKVGAADGVEIVPEQQRVDLVVSHPGGKVLLELKTFPCNYGRSGKPITNFIGGVVRDLEKLSRLRSANVMCLVVWIAYAIPDKIPATWPRHLGGAQRAASVTHCAEVIPLWPGQCAHLYIMEPLPASGT
jgi:hypothetical protein